MMQLPVGIRRVNYRCPKPPAPLSGITNPLKQKEVNLQKNFREKEQMDSICPLLSFETDLSRSAEGAAQEDLQCDHEEARISGPVVTALLVEDAPVVRFVHKTLLENLGLRVDLAVSGEEALSKIDGYVYDLVFLDIGLPGISGIETATMIRQSGSNKDTPIIILTALADSKTKRACMNAGIDFIEYKPIAPERLRQLVSHFYVQFS